MASHQPQLHDHVTLESCAAACHRARLALAGVDAGNHCWCGASVAAAAAQLRLRPRAECEASVCHGNTSERVCGGVGRMLVYSYSCHDCPAPPAPAPAPPPPPSGGDGGAFGSWAQEEGLPLFRYELDQTTPRGAGVAAAYYHKVGGQPELGLGASDNFFEFGESLGG